MTAPAMRERAPFDRDKTLLRDWTVRANEYQQFAQETSR
jgi:hypothetical protein